MGYQRGLSPQPATTALAVEQARRLNAALRLELAALTTEHANLAPKVETMRKDVSAARKKLTRQIRDLNTVRGQMEQIATVAPHVSTLPESVHGGHEGLQDASASQGRKGPSHGTRTRYVAGCRCDACLGWRKRASAQTLEGLKRKRERDIAAAVAQAMEAAA